MTRLLRMVSASAVVAFAVCPAGALVATPHATQSMMEACSCPPTTCACFLKGDVNGSCAVNIDDLLLLLSSWGCVCGQHCFNPCADIDRDGDVDQADLDILLANWGTHC